MITLLLVSCNTNEEKLNTKNGSINSNLSSIENTDQDDGSDTDIIYDDSEIVDDVYGIYDNHNNDDDIYDTIEDNSYGTFGTYEGNYERFINRFDANGYICRNTPIKTVDHTGTFELIESHDKQYQTIGYQKEVGFEVSFYKYYPSENSDYAGLVQTAIIINYEINNNSSDSINLKFKDSGIVINGSNKIQQLIDYEHSTNLDQEIFEPYTINNVKVAYLTDVPLEKLSVFRIGIYYNDIVGSNHGQHVGFGKAVSSFYGNIIRK